MRLNPCAHLQIALRENYIQRKSLQRRPQSPSFSLEQRLPHPLRGPSWSGWSFSWWWKSQTCSSHVRVQWLTEWDNVPGRELLTPCRAMGRAGAGYLSTELCRVRARHCAVSCHGIVRTAQRTSLPGQANGRWSWKNIFSQRLLNQTY